MKKVITMLFLLINCFLITACENTDYERNTYTITNNLNEKYDIVYKKKAGFPDISMDVQIYKEDRKIADYSTQYDDRHMPEKIIFLFNNQCELFYMETIDAFYIFVCGNKKANQVELTHNEIQLRDDYNELPNSLKAEYLKLSNIMQKNISRQELIDKFQTCEYDDKYILELYDFYK